MRYIELNPVRADMVAYSAEYPWSSYRFNALGHGDDLVTPHVEFHRLGADDKERIQWRVEPIARGGDRKSTQFKINRV